jgi:hypothetical protein
MSRCVKVVNASITCCKLVPFWSHMHPLHALAMLFAQSSVLHSLLSLTVE